MGDLNINLLNHDNASVNEFLSAIHLNSFVPLIDKPTRVTETSSSLIDNILTNNYGSNVLSGLFYNDITDHFPVFQITHFKFHAQCTPTRKFRCINESTIRAFEEKVYNVDWSDVFNCTDTDEVYNMFIDMLSKVYDDVFVMGDSKTKRKIIKKPWITVSILKKIRLKNKLFKKYRKNCTDDNKKRYVKVRNNVTKILRCARINYYKLKFQLFKGNMKKTWNMINELLGKCKKNLPSYVTINGIDVHDEKDIANNFNTYFVNIGASMANSIQQDDNFVDFLSGRCNNTIFLKPVKETEILEIIKNMNSSSSSGIDDISPLVVKKIIYGIVKPLCFIYNLSFSSGIVPLKLKTAKVTPVYKKKDIHDISNYRPISVLPVFSKILERLAYNRIFDFLYKNTILNEFQYGFMKNVSTEMALIDLHDYVVNSFANKLYTVGVFLDLSKAFDSIDYSILLHKLSYYGIRGLPYSWFKSYLHNRNSSCVLQQCHFRFF